MFAKICSHRNLISSASALVLAIGFANAAQAANLSLTLTSSLNPAISGQQVTYTANISGPDPMSHFPTGTWTLYDGATVLAGPVALLCPSKQTNCPIADRFNTLSYTSTPTVGSHTITILYSGDGKYDQSFQTLTEIVTP